jgi:hypothetical protein
MAVNLNNPLKTIRMQDIADAIDAGAGPGTLEIGTAGMAEVLLIFTFSDPCGSVAGDPAALTFSGMPKSAVSGAAGVAAEARIKDSAATVVVAGLSVGGAGSGANIEISSVNIVNGQTVNLISGQLVHG